MRNKVIKYPEGITNDQFITDKQKYKRYEFCIYKDEITKPALYGVYAGDKYSECNVDSGCYTDYKSAKARYKKLIKDYKNHVGPFVKEGE